MAFIGLLGARIGTAVLDSCGELGNEVFDEIGMFVSQVGFFGGIALEIVELHKRESFVFEGSRRLGAAPTTGTRAEGELPRAAPDGKGAIN